MNILKKDGLLTSLCKILCVLVLLVLLIVQTGCGSGTESTTEDKDANSASETEVREVQKEDEDDSKSDETATSSGEGKIKISKPVFLKYSDKYSDYPEYAYYFSYTNTGGAPVRVDELKVTVYDEEEVIVDQTTGDYAPVILEPGETGYCGGLNLNYDGSYPDGGLKIKAEPDYEQAEGQEPALTCSNPKETTADYVDSNVQDLKDTLQVEVKNNSDEDFSTAQTVVGLYDSSDELIGVAMRLESDFPPGATVRVECDEVVLQKDKTFKDVKSFEAQAASSEEASLF